MTDEKRRDEKKVKINFTDLKLLSELAQVILAHKLTHAVL